MERRYNGEHRHSSLGLLTPAMVYFGQTGFILRQRQQVLDASRAFRAEGTETAVSSGGGSDQQAHLADGLSA